MKKALNDLKSFVTVAMVMILAGIVIANIFGKTLDQEVLILVTNLITAVFTYYFNKDISSNDNGEGSDDE